MHHSITANKRKDGLYHAYNLASFNNNELKVDYLSEMLEGQVAILSSGFLSANESLQVLDALKASSLYRADQNSYILYPNKQLPKFLVKNNIPASLVNTSKLLQKLIEDGNNAIIEKDILGGYHFNGNFKNADDLSIGLDKLNAPYQNLVSTEKQDILDVFEAVFNHKEFTGRSGTFFAFEGLGSIYWHMVSKLAVAVQETCLRAINSNEPKEIVDNLITHYYDVVDGIGVHKSPSVYGAFPITPYSHTPLHKGAQQPGMTGQVKEDILTRIGELGVKIENNKLIFAPQILCKSEFLKEQTNAHFILIDGTDKHIELIENSLAFTVCQVPVVYKISSSPKVEIEFSTGAVESYEGNFLNDISTEKVINRTGEIVSINVHLQESCLQEC